MVFFSAKTESIEARLSISNLCDDESFLCDELEERVDVSRRATFAHGQSLFAEINTMVKIDRTNFNEIRFCFQENFSHESVSQCLDSSNIETSDDMELQILLSKSESFNSVHLKDLVKKRCFSSVFRLEVFLFSFTNFIHTVQISMNIFRLLSNKFIVKKIDNF